MCPNCRAFITVDDRVCPYCELKLGPRAIDRRSPAAAFGGLISATHFTTILIMLVNIGMYLATVLYATRRRSGGGLAIDLDAQTLVDFGAKYFGQPPYSSQWWRLVTAGFLHGGLMHIAMNMWGFLYVGVQVDEVYGTSRYVFIYLTTSAFGFLASAWWSPDVPSIGASAGIFGLIGAMIALGFRDRSEFGTMIRSLYTRWALYGLAFGILPSLIGISFMDNAAHLGGITSGFALGYLAGTPRMARPWMEMFWRVAAGAAVLITALCFVKMYFWLVSG